MIAQLCEIQKSDISQGHEVQAKRKDDKNFGNIRLPDHAEKVEDELRRAFQKQQYRRQEHVPRRNILMKKHEQERRSCKNGVAGDKVIVRPTHILYD